MKITRRVTQQTSSTSEDAFTSGEFEHAREVFFSFDADNSGAISAEEMGYMLQALDLDASEEEAAALFKYLDTDGSGGVTFDNFLPWYSEATETAKESASFFQNVIRSRRSVHKFDKSDVDEKVLRRAIECAIASPNRGLTEPWRFIRLGPETVANVAKAAKLQAEVTGTVSSETMYQQEWTDIPGWVVVTYKLSPNNKVAQREDYKSVCCAVENLMLSMWSEGIGSKWTDGPFQQTPEFSALCGIDLKTERVAGVIWYGFASGGLAVADPKKRKKGVDEVLGYLP